MTALPKARKTFSVRLTYFFSIIVQHFHLPYCGEAIIYSTHRSVWGLS